MPNKRRLGILSRRRTVLPDWNVSRRRDLAWNLVMQSRRCSTCRKKVPADSVFVSQLKAYCSYECLKKYVHSDKGSKALEKAQDRSKREKKAKVLSKLKTRSDWIREAQSAFNAYVRWRDRDKPCISCGRFASDKIGGNPDAGHFRSRGSSAHLRWHLWNVHAQCKHCNRWRSGAVTEYRTGLIARIGQEKVNILESLQDGPKHDIEYAKRIKSIFMRLLRNRQKMRGNHES
jgi:hypothetical protein